MTDRRLTPANDHVALAGFATRGQREVSPEQTTVSAPLADLRDRPDGARDRQLLFGARFDVLERRGGWAFGVAARDGYVGYIAERDLTVPVVPTHVVGVRATHLYPRDDFKSEAMESLSFGSRVTVIDERRKFMQIDTGHYIPKAHLRLIDRPFSDPVTIAQLHFGTPYLWGGNSVFGIDCSGLVQAALLACGSSCPGDSDMQQALGVPFEDAPKRGDLFFWTGHVAMAVDDTTLIHANAHHMAVAYEPIDKAIARINAQGDGDVIARRRL